MDEYYRLAQCLPQPYAAELAALPIRCAPYVQEIRLRAGQSMLFTVNGRVSPAAKYLPRADRLRRLTAKEVQDCFQHLCRDSVFAYEEELRQGFFTIRGGCRVGVAGSWGPGGFSWGSFMENRFEIQGNCLIIHLPKEVDHMVTDEIRRDSDEIIRKKYIRTITFDFSGTTFMDSSGIGLLMGRYRMMGMRGDCIQATGVNSYIEKLLHLSGVYKFVEIC